MNDTTGPAATSIPTVTRAFDAVAWKMAERLKTAPLTPDQPLDLALRGFEFWTPLIALLMLAYALEAFAGFRANAQREKERSGGGAA